MNYIGIKINKPITDYDYYATVANWCNKKNAKIEDKGKYYEVVAIEPHTPTLKEQLETKEYEYQMNRWQREAILAEGSPYSEFTKTKAQEIETLAKDLRK